MRIAGIARRPDMTLEDVRKKMWIVDMSYLQETNVEEVTRTKMQKCQQCAFETRKKRPGYAMQVLPVINGCLCGKDGQSGGYIDRRRKECDKSNEDNATNTTFRRRDDHKESFK